MVTRIVTGTVLAVLAIIVIAHGGLVYFLLMAALGVLSLNEFYRLTRLYKPLALPGLVSLVVVLAMSWFGSASGLLGVFALALLLIALTGFLVGPRRGITARMGITLLGVIYVGLGFAALLLLRRLGVPGITGGGAWIVAMVVFGAWGGDTMAYFIGKWFGHTPMAPRLSPRKTWEGFAGGALSTILLVVFISLMPSNGGYKLMGAGSALLVGVAIAVAGPLGDLFESLVKRDVQIKDSGRGLPGHGGILDRFDALLWAAVAVYFLLTLAFGY